MQTLAGSERAQFAARGVQTARAFYASHRRTVLLGVAIAIAATLAVRMVGVRAPFLQRSELGGQAVNTAKVDAPKGKPSGVAGAVKPGGEAIDVAPTASIAQPPAKPDGPDLAPESGPSASELMAAIPPGISPSLRDAVAAGQPAAQYELAMRLFEGRGLPKDQPAAARWFERAASLGLAPAQYRLGSMYEKGIGVTRDPAAAKRWYLKAAQAGNARAAHNLAVMSAEPGGGEPNYPEAAKWFRRAAELGVRDSQYNLAILYARGLGVEKDLGQSFLWFSLAAQQGDADAAKKRDEIAGEMDPASLASAVEALMKFKAVKPDPAANAVAAPPARMGRQAGLCPAQPVAAARRRGSPATASLTGTSGGAMTPSHRRRRLPVKKLKPCRKDNLDPPLAGSRPRLRLRLLGLTDLHANLYPYDYYRDRPDNSVGLARAASLVAAGPQGGSQLPIVRQRRHSSGHAARRLRGSSNNHGPDGDPPRHRRHEHA